MVGTEIESIQYRQNTDGTNKRYISGSLVVYKPSQPYPEQVYKLETSASLPTFLKSSINGSGNFVYDPNYKLAGSFSYNSSNNITEQIKADDVPQVYVWGYNNGYPIAQVSGTTYSNAITGLNESILQNPSNEAALRTELNKIRQNIPAALVTTHTYIPQLGLTSSSDANNRLTTYEYDGFARLTNIKDNSGHIVKNYKYNYNVGTAITASAQSLFYSAALAGNFTRPGCLNGTRALPVFYSIVFGRYISSISQADADAKAALEYNTNGQALANQQPCLYYNVARHDFVIRSNCHPDSIGTGVTYTVPADKYSSDVSQAAANNMARSDWLANGAAYANANAPCYKAVNVNYANGSGGTVQVTYNHQTGTPYSFSLSAGTGTIRVPEGIHSVSISVSGATGPFEFNLGCMLASGGSGMIFHNVNVSSSSCNVLTVSTIN